MTLSSPPAHPQRWRFFCTTTRTYTKEPSLAQTWFAARAEACREFGCAPHEARVTEGPVGVVEDGFVEGSELR